MDSVSEAPLDYLILYCHIPLYFDLTAVIYSTIDLLQTSLTHKFFSYMCNNLAQLSYASHCFYLASYFSISYSLHGVLVFVHTDAHKI